MQGGTATCYFRNKKNRKSLTMTQIHGKEYGVNQEMFNVSNLLFTNQSICFLRQEGYPA